jgi:hypothetical protein
MVRQARRIRELKRTEKESRRYREEIPARGWVPHVLCDMNGAYWDGITVSDSAGELVGVSEAARKQMINMTLDGYFGEEVKDAFVDEDRYWKIRDSLITWPNQQVITKEMLRVLDLSRKVEEPPH